MSEQALRVTEKTQTLPDAVTVFIGRKVFEGWLDLSVTRELNAAASDFQMKLTDKWRTDKEVWTVQPGDPVHIHIGKRSLFTGYVDKMESSASSNERSISISGRSKTGDLVDCSAEETNFSNLTLKEVAEKLCAPFGIKVSYLADVGSSFDAVTIQQGETVFATLERLAKQRKVLMYPDYEGNLVFASEGSRRARTELRGGVNVKSGSAQYDNSNRFSKYVVKGQNIGWVGDEEDSTSPSSEATDSGVSRYRPMLLMAESSVDDGTSEDRAAYEAAVRRAKAFQVEVEVQGFFQADGSLWEINEQIFADIGFLGVRRQMVVSKVTFSKNGSGTTTTLSLALSGSFDFKKDKKKPDPLGWAKSL